MFFGVSLGLIYFVCQRGELLLCELLGGCASADGFFIESGRPDNRHRGSISYCQSMFFFNILLSRFGFYLA